MSAPSLPAVDDRSRLAPWEAEPHRLWSLWDIMNIFPLHELRSREKTK